MDRMDKENVICLCRERETYRHIYIYIYRQTHHTHIYIHNGILFGLFKKENSAICDNIDEPGDIMLNEMSQSQKWKSVWFYLYELSKIVKLTEAESRLVVARD